jgi:hypothetical protein
MILFAGGMKKVIRKFNIVKIISFTLDGKEISQKVKFPFIMFPVNDDFTPSEK